MTPLDIRPIPLSGSFASSGIALSDYCGFVDEAVIHAILGNDGSDSKPRLQPVVLQASKLHMGGSTPYFGERPMAFAR